MCDPNVQARENKILPEYRKFYVIARKTAEKIVNEPLDCIKKTFLDCTFWAYVQLEIKLQIV